MRVIIEKLLLYIVLTGFYFADAEGASLIIALFAFILFFSMDLSGHRFIIPAATAIFTLSLLLGGGWIYYVPLLSFSMAGRYGKWAIATFILHLAEPKSSLIVLSGIVIYMVYLREGMSALELENKKVRDQLTSDNLLLRRQHNELLKNHEKDIYMAGLNERNRIARDMHDALGHSLSSSILLIESLQYVRDEEKLKESLRLLQGRLKLGMDDIRMSIHHLYETSIDLKSRIEDYMEDMEPFAAELYYDVDMEIGHEVKIDILSIVKEALTNVKKHSQASEVNIYIKEQNDFLTLSIKDNGSRKPEKNKGMGLLSMQETVAKYSGIFNTFYDGGFTVHITLYKEGIR
ncbi:sensor histidine kinase [Salinicoccus carnicancri]|uniref:sensor histidine kinase n=1 Tax=Salinicoccus carnicancri TaxID=558170 RepID=UPI0003074C93|nr:histidine kinase [Salinicoccus carnicancri]